MADLGGEVKSGEHAGAIGGGCVDSPKSLLCVSLPPDRLMAILADAHSHLDARVDALVADCDLAVHGRDIGNAGVLERLRPRQGRDIAVSGNNDSPRKWPPEERHFLDNLREHEDPASSFSPLFCLPWSRSRPNRFSRNRLSYANATGH
jgi:hypothetical protein